jgi:drug/metabolite transporter (DMT)-like permease
MSQYNRIPQISAAKPSLDLDSDRMDLLQAIPSDFDVALNGETDRAFLTTAPTKSADAGLLDPEAFRRLSMSTISSMTYSRGVSPIPVAKHNDRRWRGVMMRWWDRNQGLVFVTLSQAFGALMNVTTRLLETEDSRIGPFQILFARMSLTVCFCLAWMWWKNVPDYPLGPKGVRMLLVARGLTGFFGIFGLYYSLQYLAVSDAIVLTFLAPGLASYGCYLFLREPFPLSAQYASLISLVGVVLIAQPTTFFSSSGDPPMTTEVTGMTNSTSTNEVGIPTATSSERLRAVGFAMLGVLGSAGAYTALRWIGKRAHVVISVNYFATWCTIVSTFALTLAQPLHLSNTLHFALPSGIRQWAMLVFLGMCGFLTQFLLTKGLSVGGRLNSARATNMTYTHMLFALALDKLVFGQSPGWWSVAGSGLILGSAIYVAMQKQEGESTADEAVVGGNEDEEIGMLSFRGRRDARGGDRAGEELGVM